MAWVGYRHRCCWLSEHGFPALDNRDVVLLPGMERINPGISIRTCLPSSTGLLCFDRHYFIYVGIATVETAIRPADRLTSGDLQLSIHVTSRSTQWVDHTVRFCMDA